MTVTSYDAPGRSRGIPTATNVDHIAWTVPDMEQALSFFVDVLGGEEILRAGPFLDDESDWMATQFDVDPRASVSLALVRLGPTQVIELMDWHEKDQTHDWPRHADIGGTHLAIRVRDLGAAVEYLVGHGCSPCGDPVLLSDVPHAGQTILFVRTPIDLYLELIMPPTEPMPYEATTAARLLETSPDWRND